MQKVFNIGFPKSGTTSFEYAMDILGYKVYHGNWRLKHNDYMLALWIHRDFEEIRRMSTYWEAFADAPWGGTELYKELYQWYPDAKFIYTVRDAEDWYQSIIKMLTRYDSNLLTALDTYHANQRYGFANFIKHTFDITNLEGVKQKMIDHYNDHYSTAIEFLKANEVDILEFDSNEGNGWNKLCSFLDKPIPKKKYPYLNKHSNLNSDPPNFLNKVRFKLKYYLKKISTDK
ncbi:sulfotransferase family protein [Fulvivirga lutimaris]|uniref:sulfotransferase family protein n=1 Tax=Fulvivirga lutimaris TaxID=1819566 RepID=UPI0012BCC3FD|nr:sulfotransferase family protein [Fulvivirga lutimaris]MTI38300.1 hypothetical protein [Fulvivirga lutimaris]